ncbi:2-dehydropantoate 2-reductase [Ectobacillus sp. JY-23]|uniref:2-dehydropantoate 2-reductase n=1 Tax=Ectobacillus sp. JY-23 TaxID=2933872 RepID=UPI001FF6C4BD|nr:2-dehydropantoate 2-reductase [Ectobacillus sp. JY-23]UOY93739.1 2-dehydropantoate 2-reductase [Ectobacillus sp. JY-23]
MKIGIVGAGAVGLLFGFYLGKHAQVTMYTRTLKQADLIQEQGIVCYTSGKAETTAVKAKVLGEELPADEFLLVATKQYHITDLLPLLSECESKRIIFAQNGMGHLSAMQTIQKSIAVAIVEHGAKKVSGNEVEHTGQGVTKFGIVQGDSMDFTSFLACFTSAFTVLEELDWKQVMQHKLIVNACINPLTALYRVSNGELIYNAYFYQTMRQLFIEVLQLLDVQESEFHWKRVCEVCEQTASNKSSMLTDVTSNRPTEIDAILGYLLQLPKAREVKAPLVSFLHKSIKGLEM